MGGLPWIRPRWTPERPSDVRGRDEQHTTSRDAVPGNRPRSLLGLGSWVDAAGPADRVLQWIGTIGGSTTTMPRAKKGNPMEMATARHILVKTVEEALELKGRIDGGEDFAEMAKAHSECPSGKSGGSLGEFGPGKMVKEFDAVVFGDLPVGQVSEPIKTSFGYHLIQVEQRVS